ncbi:unnamed protein product, partial [Rotaria magnacalcarata]
MNDIDNRRSQLMNQHIRDKTEKSEDKENEAAAKVKISHIEIEAKQHEDKLRDLE